MVRRSVSHCLSMDQTLEDCAFVFDGESGYARVPHTALSASIRDKKSLAVLPTMTAKPPIITEDLSRSTTQSYVPEGLHPAFEQTDKRHKAIALQSSPPSSNHNFIDLPSCNITPQLGLSPQGPPQTQAQTAERGSTVPVKPSSHRQGTHYREKTANPTNRDAVLEPQGCAPTPQFCSCPPSQNPAHILQRGENSNGK